MSIDDVEFVQLLLKAIIYHHGVLQEIVSDRETCFTLDFWAQQSKWVQSKLHMFIVFHPQAARLLEISNE